MAFALLERRDPDGPPRVHELFATDPALHGALKVVEVPDGVVVGWMQRPDGSFGPFVPSIEAAREERLREFRFACRHAIIGGFVSSALGAPHRYGSTDTDQTNLDRAAMAALAGQRDPSWTAQIPCAPEGEPDAPIAFVAHGPAAVHRASSDLHAWIEGCRLKRDALAARVMAAASAEDVLAVVWG